MIQNRNDCCKHNAWIQCEEQQCENCGWNPEVVQARKAKIFSELIIRDEQARTKRVKGLNIKAEKHDYTPTVITVTIDESGSSLYLSDDSKGVMLMIPLESVSDMLQIVEKKK